MVNYCNLFYSFFKIGTFTIGGGYAMIPLMKRELVDRHSWLTQENFLDQVAIAQAMPGVFAVNMAALTGLRLRGKGGAIAAVLGNIIMPIVFILLLAIFFRSFRDNIYVSRIFMGLRPAVAALIAAPVFTLARSAKVTWSNCYIPILSALLIWLLGVNPIFIILAAALLGYIVSRFDSKH